VLVGEWRFIPRKKKKILCQCVGPFPGHEVDYTVLDMNNGSLHAQRNSEFTLLFYKMYFFVTPVIIPHLTFSYHSSSTTMIGW
jgi:hypothetical protein